MKRWASDTTETADILDTSVDSGEVRCSLGYADGEVGIGSEVPIYGIGTILARPADATNGEAAMAIYTQSGNQKHVFAWRDNRYSEKAGSLSPGDTAIVCTQDARIFVKDSTSAAVMYSVNQTSDDSMILEVNGQEGEIRIVNGKSAIVITKDKITITNGKTTLLFDDDGLFGYGAHCGLNFNGGNLGTLVADAPPIPGVMSLLLGPTGMAGVPSLKWTIGG